MRMFSPALGEKGCYLCFRLIRGHEVIIRPDLRQQALRDDVVVGGVSSVVPVFDHLSKHSAGFPPIVWTW